MLGNGETHDGTPPCVRLRTSGGFSYGDAHKKNLFKIFFLILFLSICRSVDPYVRTKMVRPIAKLLVGPMVRPLVRPKARPVIRLMVRPMVRVKVRPTVRLKTSQYTKDEKCANLRTPGADFFTGYMLLHM